MVLLKVIRMAVVNHRPLGRSVLNRRRRIGVLDGVKHGIEQMRSNYDMTRPDLGHGLFGGILALDLFSFGLFGFRPVSHKDAVAEPFFLRTF